MNWGWFTVIEGFKGGHFDGGVVIGIITLFSDSKPGRLLAMSLVGHTTEVRFEALIEALGLVICLRVICCVVKEFGVVEFEKVFPENGEVNLVTVVDNGIGRAMEFMDMGEEEFGKRGSCERVG